ncbi:type II toxin-antitoxin system HicB family antitoxin [Patescibacteria group bacterium]|nr:type II toxin-antitoxin system HicB family antitoxin [Patescibacteria group bacterium]MBU4368704.1 type II toxin-antitoxin system HicB family antitoxin [Patescibacteria group bacterium]
MASKSLRILLYSVVIEPCEEGGYFADCPILQGCHAEGETYAEVIENIEDVIKAHIEIRKKHKEFIPSVIIKDRKNISVNLPLLVKA